MAAEARQKRRLRLSHDIAGDAHHHVVEAAVLEVILDARSARPGDRAVEDVQLPMVGATDFVLAPVETLVVGEEAVPVEREHVVDDDLRSRRREAGEHLARLLVGPGAEPVDDHAHLDTVRELPLQQRSHPHSDLTLPPAEHEDVHGRARCLDVLEDAREEVRAFDPRLDRRRRRPRKVECRIVGARPATCDEGLRRGLGTRRCHRIGRRRPTRALRDSEHLPVDADEQRRRHQRDDCESPAPTPASVATHCRRKLHAATVGDRRRGSSPGSRSPSRQSASS